MEDHLPGEFRVVYGVVQGGVFDINPIFYLHLSFIIHILSCENKKWKSFFCLFSDHFQTFFSLFFVLFLSFLIILQFNFLYYYYIKVLVFLSIVLVRTFSVPNAYLFRTFWLSMNLKYSYFTIFYHVYRYLQEASDIPLQGVQFLL